MTPFTTTDNKPPKLIKLTSIHYDENGYSKRSFDYKDGLKVKIRIDPPNSMVYIMREDNLLVLFKKKLKTKDPTMIMRRAKVYIQKFCNIRFLKAQRQRRFR